MKAAINPRSWPLLVIVVPLIIGCSAQVESEPTADKGTRAEASATVTSLDGEPIATVMPVQFTPVATSTATPTPTAAPIPTDKDMPTPAFTPMPAVAEEKAPATLVRVIDGDTIEVDIDGQSFGLRYIGIDTPEISGGVECFGEQATQRNQELVEGQILYLEKDVSETDRYGRLLRYVWTVEGKMVNEVLVAEGFAQAATYPPDVRYMQTFVEAQRAAMESEAGLWAECATSPTLTPPPASTLSPTLTPLPSSTIAPGQDCDPSYPDDCIPPYPPDLDCGEINLKNIQVVGEDPHGFDHDGNGVGCEE